MVLLRLIRRYSPPPTAQPAADPPPPPFKPDRSLITYLEKRQP